MDEEKVFLDALEADPGDDVTRLVYADWLDERGDGRSAFLRAEHRLATMPEADPDLYDAEQECARVRRRLDPGWVEGVGRLFDLWLVYVLPQSKAEVICALRKHFCGLEPWEEFAERREYRRPCRSVPIPSRGQAERMAEQLPSCLRRGLTRAAAEQTRLDFCREAFDWRDVPPERFLPWVVIVPAARPTRQPCSFANPQGGHELWLHGYVKEPRGPMGTAIYAVTRWPVSEVINAMTRPLPWRLLQDVSLDQVRLAARHFPPGTDLEVICRHYC